MKTHTNVKTSITFKGGGGGPGPGQKVWEHDFKATSDPKGPQHGPTFWSCFKAPGLRPLGP